MGALVFDGDLVVGTVEQNVQDLGRQIAHRRIQAEAIQIGQRPEIAHGHAVFVHGIPAHGLQRALVKAQVRIGDDGFRGDAHHRAQTAAFRTGPKGAVEAEHAGRELLDGHAALRTRVVLGKQQRPLVKQVHQHQTAAFPGGGLHAVSQALTELVRGAHDQTVHHDFNVVLFLFVQLRRIIQLVELAVDAHAHKAALLRVFQNPGVLALARADHRREQLQPLPLRIRHHLIGHLVDGLLADLAAAFGAVRHAHARIEQTQIVVDFSYGPHGGTGISRRGLLVDGNGGGQTLNGVDIRLFHLPQKHARIGGQALHIAALSLGVNGVKSQAGFAGPAQAREHHQLVARDFQCDVFQIMFARAANDELVLQGIDRPLCLYGRAGINAPRSARTPASLRPAWRHVPRRNASWYRGAYR